jgi:hypothetical protein
MNPVSCMLCNRSVNLTVDLCCDENGKAVHGDRLNCKGVELMA